MQAVEHHRIDRQDPRWAAIVVAAFASKHLYNATLYLTRQAYIKDHSVSSYHALDTLLQPTEQYRALPAKVAQWVLKQVLSRLDQLFRRLSGLGRASRDNPGPSQAPQVSA